MKIMYSGDLIYTSFAGESPEFFQPFGLIVESGMILQVGPLESVRHCVHDRWIKLGDGCVIPGLIDAHVHLATDLDNGRFRYSDHDPESAVVLVATIFEHAEAMLRSGITSCRDLGGWNGINIALRNAVDAGLCPGPRILASGEAITVTGGSGCRDIGIVCDGIDEVRRGVRRQIGKKADVVKLMVTGGVYAMGNEPSPPVMTRDEILAAVEIAHVHGRSVAVHAHGNTGIRESVSAGVDSIEHGVYLSEDIMEVMRERGTYLVPTLSAPYFASLADLEKGAESADYLKAAAVITRHNQALLLAHAKGVRIAMGSDSGSPHNRFHDAPYELVLMNQCGIAAHDVLQAATVTSAKLLGVDQYCGRLAPGMRADFLLLENDPLQDLSTVTDVLCVWKDGIKSTDRAAFSTATDVHDTKAVNRS